MAFTFRDRIPELVGAPGGVLDHAREALATTHRVTQAGDASRISETDVRQHVVAVLVEVMKDRLRGPLVEELDAVLAEARANHELMEGDEPTAGDASENDVAAWWLGLEAAYRDALRGGDVETVVGTDFFDTVVDADATPETIADAVLAVPVADVPNMLGRLGVTPEAVKALVDAVRAPPAGKPAAASVPASPNIVTFDLPDFASIVRQRLAEGADVLEMDDLIKDVVSAVDDEPLARAVAAITQDPAEAQAITDWIHARAEDGGTDAAQDMADSEEILRLATEDMGVPAESVVLAEAQNAAAPVDDDQPRKGRGRGRPAGRVAAVETDETRANRAALVAFCDNAAVTEQAAAELLGISRSHLNNYRAGRAIFEATPEQRVKLNAEMMRYARALADAAGGILPIT